VVYNDCLRVRAEAYAAGERISDAEVQRRVITLAKGTPQRAWLGEVASVALVQACQDARWAYRSWFDSLSGKRKGREVGHPRFRRKHGRQSIRLTRNGFTFHGRRLYVAKVRDIEVKWSRDLPSVPPCDREVGIDLGLKSLVVTSGGEVVPNPRFWRAAQRRLARAQRVLSRRQKGSRNRARARHQVAVLRRKVRETRLDHAHKVALRLVRDNQAVYAEDLCVAGLARTRLARSVSETVHDRDVNAARNMLAAGRVGNPNACGAGARPHPVAADAEAGTHRSAA